MSFAMTLALVFWSLWIFLAGLLLGSRWVRINPAKKK